MKNDLLAAARRFGMIPKRGGVIVAYSGGADSSALLHSILTLSKELGFPVMAAHVNHMLRGDEADRDEAFCRRTCEAYGIPIEVLKTDVAAYAKERSLGTEDAARQVRYAFFEKLMDTRPEYAVTATAHTASDNAETVLFRLFRGTGPDGLCGIPPKRDRYIRPLLFSTRDDILAYCEANSIEYVTDRTNSDVTYSRNMIRAEIMPAADSLFGDPSKRMAETSLMLSDDRDFLEAEAGKAYAVCSADGGLSAGELLKLHPALRARVILAACRKTGGYTERKHIAIITDALEAGQDGVSFDLPGGIAAHIRRGILMFEKSGKEEELSEDYDMELPSGLTVIPGGAVYLLNGPKENLPEEIRNFNNSSIIAEFGSDRIHGVIRVRNRRNGDTLLYGSMHRKVKKLMCDSRMPAELRRRIPVFTDSDGIFWIPGFRQRDGSRPSDSGVITIVYTENTDILAEDI